MRDNIPEMEGDNTLNTMVLCVAIFLKLMDRDNTLKTMVSCVTISRKLMERDLFTEHNGAMCDNIPEIEGDQMLTTMVSSV